ncbi:MAG: hypothetical protein QUS14_09935 [Pyrinomonadaceae bacterium]|nr:hypothetical protein [Pyrinomonadaceae bacterium]
MRSFASAVYFAGFLLFASGINAQNRVSNFGLKNQFDRYVEVNFPSDRPVVLIFGDRKGSGQTAGWSEPIYKKFDGKIYVFGIASLSGVPSYARPLVRRLIKGQTDYPVLLDWGGKVATSLGYEKQKAMVLLVSRNGTIRSRRSGAATSAELEKLMSEVESELR